MMLLNDPRGAGLAAKNNSHLGKATEMPTIFAPRSLCWPLFFKSLDAIVTFSVSPSSSSRHVFFALFLKSRAKREIPTVSNALDLRHVGLRMFP
jgi:hypothetical protein